MVHIKLYAMISYILQPGGLQKISMKKLSLKPYKALFPAVCILFFLFIVIVMIHTEGGVQPFLQIGKRKLFLLAAAELLFLLLLIAGDRISSRIRQSAVFRWLEIALLVLTPGILFVIVQAIIQLCDKKAGSFSRLFRAVFAMRWDAVLRNLTIYFFILILFLMIIKKVGVACTAYTIFLILLALVNYYVTEFRGQAFLLLDVLGIGTAAEVAGEYRMSIPANLGIILLFSMDFCVFQLKFQKLDTARKSWKKIPYVLCHLAALGISALCVFIAMQSAGNVSFWNTNRTYKNGGYLCSLLNEVHYLRVEKPEGYSVERVQEIAGKIPAAETSDTAVIPQNILMIMNESLADFEALGDLKTDTEILPFIHSLRENVTYGKLHIPTFGGGTARSEYEALTGNSMYFLPGGSVPYQLYVKEPEAGMAQILKAQGYLTAALHPNKASNWNRASVYKSMGFDTFLSKENWGNFDVIRHFASDRASFQKIIELYENKKPGEKLFSFCVTMQNHGGYGTGTLKGYEPSVKLHYKNDYPEVETYLSLARESDRAFQELVEYFEKESEPTMIVMFGDHWPKVQSRFASDLLGQNHQKMDLKTTQQTYVTPYVIWTNYPSETSEEDFSSNYLGSLVLQKAGAELTPYHRFLLELKEKLPVIGVGAVRDAAGNWYAQDQVPEEYQELLEEYQILEYNNEVDRKHRVDKLFFLP